MSFISSAKVFLGSLSALWCLKSETWTLEHVREVVVVFLIKGSQVFFLLPVGGLRWNSSYSQAPELTAAPVRALIDEQISIKGRFLRPHCPVTVCAQMHSEDGDLWEAFAHYNMNADGTVNCESHRVL